MGKMDVSMEKIILRQVSALVAALVEVIHDDPKQQLELEAHLYRTLAVNCQDKAKMAETLQLTPRAHRALKRTAIGKE